MEWIRVWNQLDREKNLLTKNLTLHWEIKPILKIQCWKSKIKSRNTGNSQQAKLCSGETMGSYNCGDIICFSRACYFLPDAISLCLSIFKVTFKQFSSSQLKSCYTLFCLLNANTSQIHHSYHIPVMETCVICIIFLLDLDMSCILPNSQCNVSMACPVNFQFFPTLITEIHTVPAWTKTWQHATFWLAIFQSSKLNIQSNKDYSFFWTTAIPNSLYSSPRPVCQQPFLETFALDYCCGILIT